MADKVTVKIGRRAQDPLRSPSLPKILGVKAVNQARGHADDLKALKDAYGATFDSVQINGRRASATSSAGRRFNALRKALRGKTAAERTVTIDTDPS